MAKIHELLAAGRTLSFEFFPPKTPEMLESLNQAIDELVPLKPSYVSVTYGALGATRTNTRDLVVRVNMEQPFPAMPHLTCVGHTKEQIRELLEFYREAGVQNVLALAGDPPADGSPADGDFTYATELVELIREVGDFSVGVAAFPEIHPRSPDRATDRRYLAAKLEAADFGLTQFFFRAEHYTRMADELSDVGCTTPVIPGVMPFINVGGTRKMAEVNATEIPEDLQRRMDAADGDPAAVRALGVEVATELSAALVEGGAPGLHLYAMNRSRSITDVYNKLGLGPPEPAPDRS